MEERAGPSREEQILELLVFLFLFVPSMVLAFFFSSGLARAGFELVALSTIFRDLALVALVLFFLWRNGESVERIGWTTDSLAGNVTLGLLLFPVVVLGAALLEAALRELGLSGPSEEARRFLIPEGSGQFALAFILLVVVAVSEETIFRGYLIARLAGITTSVPLAVMLSTGIFALGHGYEGTAGLLTIGAMGLVFALLFVGTKSLVAPTIIHFLNNFMAIVLIPLFGAA